MGSSLYLRKIMKFIVKVNPIILFASIALIGISASCSMENNPVAQCRKASYPYVKESASGKANVGIEIRLNSNLMTAPPSYALWAEFPDGRIETIYATCKASLGYPDNIQNQPESLPVWYGVRSLEGLGPGDEGLDAVTTATPTQTTYTINWEATPADPADTVQLYLEANMPNDHNYYFTSALGSNGQPSLIWNTSFQIQQDRLQIVFPTRIVGRSDPRGKSADIYPDRNGITSALNIIAGIDIKRLNQ